jgi:hypothetical protein
MFLYWLVWLGDTTAACPDRLSFLFGEGNTNKGERPDSNGLTTAVSRRCVSDQRPELHLMIA